MLHTRGELIENLNKITRQVDPWIEQLSDEQYDALEDKIKAYETAFDIVQDANPLESHHIDTVFEAAHDLLPSITKP